MTFTGDELPRLPLLCQLSYTPPYLSGSGVMAVAGMAHGQDGRTRTGNQARYYAGTTRPVR